MPTLEQYQNMLRINKQRLDDELEVQAEIQYAIGAECARLNTRMLEAKDDLARLEGEILDELKEAKGVTVEQAKARVLADPDRRKKWAVYQQLREAHEVWTALKDAWITKGYKLADLGGLFGADYFAVRSVSGSSETRVDVPRATEERRQAVQDASRRADGEVRRRRAL